MCVNVWLGINVCSCVRIEHAGALFYGSYVISFFLFFLYYVIFDLIYVRSWCDTWQTQTYKYPHAFTPRHIQTHPITGTHTDIPTNTHTYTAKQQRKINLQTRTDFSHSFCTKTHLLTLALSLYPSPPLSLAHTHMHTQKHTNIKTLGTIDFIIGEDVKSHSLAPK